MRVVICKAADKLNDALQREFERLQPLFSCEAEGYAEIEMDLEELTFCYEIAVLPVNGPEHADGVMLAHEILAEYPDCQIIFLSEHAEDVPRTYAVEHAFNLFTAQIAAYLSNALDCAAARYRRMERQYIRLKNGKQCVCLDRSQIFYIVREGRRTVLHTATGEVVQWLSLHTLQERLGDEFRKCNSGCLVNVRMIACAKREWVELTNGKRLELSRTYRNGFML